MGYQISDPAMVIHVAGLKWPRKGNSSLAKQDQGSFY